MHRATDDLIASAQALELRGVEQASPRTQQAFELVRDQIAFLDKHLVTT